MYRIRYYQSEYHPKVFKTGLLGRTIQYLNWLRWKLEVLIQYMVMRYLCRLSSVSEEQRRLFSQAFKADVLEEQSRKVREEVLSDEAASRSRMYSEGRFASKFDRAHEELTTAEQPQDVRPGDISDLAARYGHNTRSKRYARGRLRFSVGEAGEFEPTVVDGDSP